ncbi:hypothetical protein NKR23_g582 [Pleurostoma richardsiae]|uniref:Elongin-A n=1 Tax=Pleurostoma richardsiae TaxID=41990 RepID=A0AA38VLQ1_9PEZI|nr:hypothetical protein NKR23_g582 [Pleurostoma richardsiae]
MPPRSLVEMCTAVCYHNLAHITDIGDMSYELMRPILMKIETADQLRLLEQNSPHIQGEDAEVWKKLIAKDFSIDAKKKNYVPRNPKSWYRVYARYQKEEREAMAIAEKQLMESFAGIKKEKEKHISKIVDPRLLSNVANQPGKRRRGGASGSSRLGFGGGKRTNGNDGKSVMSKVRREVSEIANRLHLSTPTGQLSARPGQIKKAPEAMINDHRIAAQPAIRIHVPTKKRPREDDGLAEREARLRAAKKQKRPEPVEVGDDDLFGEDESAGSIASPRGASPSPPPTSPGRVAAAPPRRPSSPTGRKAMGMGMLLSRRPGSPAKIRVVADPAHTPKSTAESPGAKAASRQPTQTPKITEAPKPRAASIGSKTAERRPVYDPPVKYATVARSRSPTPVSIRAPGKSSPSPPRESGSPRSPTLPAGSPKEAPVVPLRKKKTVDVFMRPKKPAAPRR